MAFLSYLLLKDFHSSERQFHMQVHNCEGIIYRLRRPDVPGFWPSKGFVSISLMLYAIDVVVVSKKEFGGADVSLRANHPKKATLLPNQAPDKRLPIKFGFPSQLSDEH